MLPCRGQPSFSWSLLRANRPRLRRSCAVLDGLDDLVKTVGFRDLSGRLSCIAGIGRDLWDRLHSDKRPKELKPFAPIEGTVHAAPSTPGDLLFHIRSERPDLCFEFERLLLDSLGAGVTVVDEVSGFRYFDSRDLLGFVDGTDNPTGLDVPAAALVGDEDADFGGGSYVVVQKYLHDLRLGRDSTLFRKHHRPHEDRQHRNRRRRRAGNRISRSTPSSMPTGTSMISCAITCPSAVQGRSNSAPISSAIPVTSGSSRRCATMYVGDPSGEFDRILDFSTPHTGTTFFAPARPTLQALVQAAQKTLTTAQSGEVPPPQ